MSDRTLVPIFFFWALLTIVTPTLILLSENSKADLDLNGNTTDQGMKARRMIGYTQNDIIRTTPPPLAKSVVAEEELASAPAPVPTPSSGTSTRATPRDSNSFHNHTLISNKTDDVLTLSSPKIHVQINQTSTC